MYPCMGCMFEELGTHTNNPRRKQGCHKCLARKVSVEHIVLVHLPVVDVENLKGVCIAIN